MKTAITWVIIFVFGFIMGAGVGFKILEGVSGDLVNEAWNNSYAQFQKAYPGSTTQRQTDAIIEQKKQELISKVKDNLSEYVMNALKGTEK